MSLQAQNPTPVSTKAAITLVAVLGAAVIGLISGICIFAVTGALATALVTGAGAFMTTLFGAFGLREFWRNL
ncbi:hypothetical protein ACFCXC_00540 [Streptomyces microflavus]|uniref:hypothetical protein n=1 Tax=Streptomyces microflavus TaxID=1919 RepID=UPI0035DD16D6